MTDRPIARRLTRRQFLYGGVVVGGMFALQACGGTTSTPAPAVPTTAPQPAQIPTVALNQPAATAARPATSAAAASSVPSVAASVAAVSAPAARTNVARDKTLIIGFEGGPVQAPEQGNPYVLAARLSQGLHQAVIESLYYLNYENGQVIPWLAESHQFNADFTQVDIKLRAGVEWSDGQPFTADDVAFTVNLLRDNATLNYGPEMQRFVKEATAVDKLTARITLKEAYPRFMFNNFSVHIWGAVRILPKHIWNGQNPLTFTFFDLAKGWPVFTGPYRMVKASSNEFVYDRRDDWWAVKTGFKPLPAPERIVFLEAGADDRKAAALEANDVDGQPSLTIDAFSKVKERNPKAVAWLDKSPYAWIDPCPGTLGFQTETPPWDNVDLRWAVSLGIDRKKYADAVGFGTGLPARYNFPFYAPLEALLNENNDLFDKYNTLEYNPQKAMQRIEKAGYTKGGNGMYQKDGKTLQANLLVPIESLTLPGISLLATNLKAIGIDAVPQGLASTQWTDKRNRGNFEIETGQVACGSVVDPFAELNLFHSQWIKPQGEIRGNNYWGYKNPEYDTVVDKIRLLPPGDAGIKPLFRQALEMRLRDLPHFAIAQQYRVVPFSSKYWTNWPSAQNNYIHPPNWWMTTLLAITSLKPATA